MAGIHKHGRNFKLTVETKQGETKYLKVRCDWLDISSGSIKVWELREGKWCPESNE